MNQLLQLGETVRTVLSAADCEVERFLGGGAQGEVYEATLAGQPVALKWYFSHYLQQDPGLRRRLEKIIAYGAPSDRFLWPLEMVTKTVDDGSFGYLMSLREPRFKGLVDLVTRRIEPTFDALITAGFELAHNYLKLHAKGLCYRDIAFGNVFFDPDTGEVRICDNDNVDVNNAPGAIGGTPRFMAPEIVRGEATPDTQTDLFSLAVLLFYLLCNHHPLEGERESAIHCFDLPAMTRLYGTEPIFIFDPQDKRNRPVPGEHDNAIAFWAIYPQFLRGLFMQAFGAGLRDPGHGRVRETAWSLALLRLRDALLYCMHCSAENFYDADTLRVGRSPVCWSCGSGISLPPRLRLEHGGERITVMLNHDSKLYPHHLDAGRRFELGDPAAAVTRHPHNPGLWGLQNLTSAKWVATTGEGAVRDVLPGRSVTLATGTRIQFGTCEGEIRL